MVFVERMIIQYGEIGRMLLAILWTLFISYTSRIMMLVERPCSLHIFRLYPQPTDSTIFGQSEIESLKNRKRSGTGAHPDANLRWTFSSLGRVWRLLVPGYTPGAHPRCVGLGKVLMAFDMHLKIVGVIDITMAFISFRYVGK